MKMKQNKNTIEKKDKFQVTQSETFFKEEQIDTFAGTAINEKGEKTDFDKKGNMVGERRKLIVLHQNGDDKNELISQLKTMISGLEDDFKGFAAP